MSRKYLKKNATTPEAAVAAAYTVRMSDCFQEDQEVKATIKRPLMCVWVSVSVFVRPSVTNKCNDNDNIT